MWRMLFTLILILGGGVASTSPAAAAPASTEVATHLGSTWDAPDAAARIQDHQAVTAEVAVDTVLTPTDNALCDLYVSTFTISWQALAGHTLTAVITEDDGFGFGWRALDTTTWTMTPSGQVFDEQSPVVRTWYLAGTHRSDPAACPRDSRTINHVEIYVDGAARHITTRSIVKPPSENHLAAVWTWPDLVTIVDPARVAVSQTFFEDIEAPEGLCEAHFVEVDLTVTAVGSARIIAVGTRSPGAAIQYQRGDSDGYSLGIGSHVWFLTGTRTRSDLCPPDTLSQDRIEIYTDAGKSG
jgi:hypothetical protein